MSNGRAADEFSVALADRKYTYGDVTLVGAFEPSPRDFDRRRVDNYGLPHVVTAAYAWVKSDDGMYYNITRQVHAVMTPRLRITVAAPNETGTDIPETLNSFYGYVREDAADDAWAMSGKRGSDEQRSGFDLRFDSGMNAHWVERGIFDLQYHRQGPAFEMYCPAHAMPWYWNSILGRIEGEVLGRHVEGFGEIEFNFGRGWQDWLEHPLEGVEYWVYYLLGSGPDAEYGAIALLNDAGFGILVEGGQGSGLYDIAYSATLGADGLPDRVEWQHRGRSWSLDLSTRRISSPRNPGFLWQLGDVVRADGAIRSGMGFLETRGAFERHYSLDPAETP